MTMTLAVAWRIRDRSPAGHRLALRTTMPTVTPGTWHGIGDTTLDVTGSDADYEARARDVTTVTLAVRFLVATHVLEVINPSDFST